MSSPILSYSSLPYPRLPENQVAIATTSSGKNDTLEPGKSFTLGVTVTNKDTEQPLDIAVELQGLPDELTWNRQPVRLALFPRQREEIVFTLQAPETALPKLVSYTLAVTDPNHQDHAGQNRLLETRQLSLSILPIDRTESSIETPSFYIEPATSSAAPQKVQPLAGVPMQVWVENSSDLVDRFRLQCDGLPNDWEVAISYPQDALGMGLMVAANSLPLNPGARGQILLTVKPPAQALAGIYVPTLRLISENNPQLTLLDLLYLEVPAIHLLQPSLQGLRSQFQQGSALFELQLLNNGNSPRKIDVEVESLDESERYDFLLERSSVEVLPQSTQTVALEITPKNKWRRPLYGGGQLSNFRLQLQDREQHSLTPEVLQGNLTWLPRPWWQLLLGVLIALGLVGGVAGLLWWFLLRPPKPIKILALESAAARYSEANGDVATVNFQVKNPEKIQRMRLTGLSQDGKALTETIEYDFQDAAMPEVLTSDALPHGLKSLCRVQQNYNLLTCHQVHTGAYLPETYTFQLEVLYEHKGETLAVSETTRSVTISPIPTPTITKLEPKSLAYLEASNRTAVSNESVQTNESVEVNEPVQTEPTLSILANKGIELAIQISNPEYLDAIKLIGRNESGEIIGEELYTVWASEQKGSLHQALSNRGCEHIEKNQLIDCTTFTTQIQHIGKFQIEAVPISFTITEALPTALTEFITIHPATPEIISFKIDGKDAPLKYLVPIDPIPDNPQSLLRPVTVSWEVAGGATTKVELLMPQPLTVDANDSISLMVTAGDRKTITLQVTDAAGNKLARSVEIEAIDPTPTDPTDTAAAAVTAAIEAMQAAEVNSNGIPPNGEAIPFGVSSPIAPDRPSPAELPPQFNNR